MFLHEHLYKINIYIILVLKIIIFVLEHRHQGLHAKSFFLQVPLAPRFVLTHYGLQGITAKHGIMLFLTRPPKMTDSDYALALYVLLSRPRQLDDVYIIGEMPEREWFETKLVEKNPVLVDRMRFFEERSATDVDRASRILAELGWLENEYVHRVLSDVEQVPVKKRSKTSHTAGPS